MQALTDIKELPEIGVAQAKKTQVYGGIAGLIVGAAIGGLYNANVSLSFIPKVGSKLSALLGFLLGAGIYGYGMSGKMSGSRFSSMTQVSGIAFAGMSLGKLLAEFNLPTFGLASEDSEWFGFTGDGRVLGLQAEDTEEEFGQNFRGRTTGNTVMRADEEEDTSASHDHVPDFSPKTFNPTMTDTTMGGVPSWTTSGLTNPSLPEYDSAVRQGMVMPMRGSVTQWYGSAEGVTHSVMGSSVGNNFSMTEGVGSVIGQ